MRTIYFLLLLLSSVLIPACKKNESGGGNPPVLDTGLVKNADYEIGSPSQDPASWQTEFDQDADQSVSGGYQSNYGLLQQKGVAYKVYTYQKITGLTNGKYRLTVWAQNSGGQNACYVNAKDYGGGVPRMTAVPVTQNAWKQVIIRGIAITNGELTIGLYSDANSNNWCRVDQWELVKDDIDYEFLKGGDVSELSYLESKGAKFFDSGVQKDCFTILKDNGFNIVRLRLYNDPGNPDFSPSNLLPAGFQNPTDILSLAKRAKDAGMQIQLTFHYSDYWTNGGLQNKPHEWDSLNFTDLKQAVYDFTLNFMNQLKAQNTLPEYVSLGNETAGGLLFPDGDYNHFPQMAALFNSGYDAVKAVSPSTQVIIHLDAAGDAGKYNWFFPALISAGGKFDIIGASYYPFWTGKTVEEIQTWAETISANFGKKIFIMETGYNWNPTLPDGTVGQLADNGPYNAIYPSSSAGQRDFLYDCFNGLKLSKNGSIIGDLYWDPVMIAFPGVGWELGATNVVSNTTLFDFDGKKLESFNAFQFNN
jgi:arabinogalactan endo-1,4-beta-galactosidase